MKIAVLYITSTGRFLIDNSFRGNGGTNPAWGHKSGDGRDIVD